MCKRFLEDVKNVTISDLHAECILVEIRLRRLKGHPNSNHSVTIEGRFAHTSLHEQVRDPVYWLERHLQVNHHLSLKTRQKWPKNVLSKKLWDMSPAAMSLRFRKRSEQAGYPCKLFSFHSLRAGFICTAIMVAGTDEEKLRGILEHTAYVADWVPFGRAQLTYVRNTSKKITVCSRLVNPKPGDTVIDLALTSIAAYHSIKLSDPKRTIKEQFQTFRNAVNDHFNDAMKHLEDGEREIRNQWKKCAKAYIDKNENLSLRAKRAFTKKKSLLFRALKENDFHTIRMKIIRQDVVCKLSKSLANLDNLVDDFVNLSDYPVRRSLDLKGSFPQEASSNCTSSSNENDLSIQQSDEESQGQSENTEGSESTNTNSDGEGKQSNQECTSSSSTQSSSSATSSSSSSPSSVEVISDNPYQLPNRLLMNNKNSTSSNAIKVKKKQKKRRFFTKEEDELLRRCKQQKMRWCDMSLQFDGRSGQDLKDRWRNLQKKQWRRHPEYSRDEVLHCLKIIHDDEDENDAKENNTHAIKVIKDDANDCSLQRNESSESEDVDDSESCSDSSEWKEIKCEDSREDDEDDRNEEEVCCDNEQMNNDLTISIVDDEDEDLNAADELIRASYRNKSDSFTKKKKSLEELSKKTSSSSVVNCKEKKLKRRSGN
ncbi:uncharacterized protein MONOS_15977 [Monocercomonoides exilis]|uniref:uncharacterized protein n=1 Tax=Monocercomonoides exilis TaxID=2049356 RepID=UPI00355A2D70|nr:hypothetical protein MONOS_15977 [Monocercomonoides exilis]